MIWEQTIAENLWRVDEGLYRILLPLPWAVPFVNAYVLESQGQYMLIDCGAHWSTSLRALGRALKAIGVPPGGLTHLVLTHRHPDHAGGTQSVHQRWGGEVWIHPKGVARPFPSAEETAAWARTHGVDAERVARLAEDRRNPVEELPAPLRYLAPGGGQEAAVVPGEAPPVPGEGQEAAGASPPVPGGVREAAGASPPVPGGVQMGDLFLEAIHVPGHCPGQVMLRERQRGWLFTADQVLNVLAPNVWANPGTGGDPLGDYLASLERTAEIGAEMESAATGPRSPLILPGHGAPMRGGLRGAVTAMVRFQRRYLQEVLDCLEGRPLTSWEVVRKLRARSGADPGAVGAREAVSLVAEAVAALIHLEEEGKATSVAPGRWARRERKEAVP